MVYRVAAGHAQLLRRSAAILLIAGAASGCSSGVMRFTDGMPTASNPPARQQTAPVQAYPGDTRRAEYLDNTYTGSVNRAAVQPATAEKPRFWQREFYTGSRSRPAPQQASGATRQPFWQRAFRPPVPRENVGQGGAPTYAQPLPPASQPYPVASQLPPPGQSYPGASQPFPAAQPGVVTRAPAPDPFPQQVAGNNDYAPLAPAMLDTTSTGSVAAPEPAQGNVVTARGGDTLRRISDRYGVSVDRLASANGLAANAQLSPGQRIVIPSFGGAAKPAQGTGTSTAALPAPVENAPVPVPTRAPAERVAVLPQQTRAAERQPSSNDVAPTGTTYTVKSGDTLSAIASRHGTTAAAIRAANGMDSGVIRVGQKLVVPGAGGARNVAAARPADPVVTGSTPSGGNVSGYTPPKRAEIAVEEAAGEAANAPDATGIGLMRWPVRGRVVSGFGDTSGPKRNDGLDIAVPEGTSIKAAENGVVIYAGDGLKDFGKTVLVRHENGLVTVYGHTSDIRVSRGDTVRRGQEIALSGVSGNADTPKLHFEVRKDSVPVNPASFLE